MKPILYPINSFLCVERLENKSEGQTVLLPDSFRVSTDELGLYKLVKAHEKSQLNGYNLDNTSLIIMNSQVQTVKVNGNEYLVVPESAVIGRLVGE
jgi:hypothetical protein